MISSSRISLSLQLELLIMISLRRLCADSAATPLPKWPTPALSGVVRTKQAQELGPAGELVRAVGLLGALQTQVPQVVQVKQVDDRQVDQLLGAEGFLQNQPL